MCLVGCHLLKIDAGGRSGSFGEVPIQEGELITVDGSSGLVYRGDVPVKRTKPEKLLEEIAHWHDPNQRPARVT